MRRLILIFGVVTLVAAGCGGTSEPDAVEYVVQQDIASYFDAEQAEGTIVLKKIGSDEPPIVFDLANAKADFAPAETFKLLATLVFRESDTLESLDTELQWDGNGPDVPPWNRTHTLRSAMGTESEWFYAQLTDELGIDPMEVWINRAKYGNGNIRGSVRGSYWLDGTLLTDAMHQAAFMADLFSDDPIFDRYAAFDVKELMQVEDGDGWTLTWSTGTDTTAEDPVSWLIGSVMTGDQDWAIAMHIRIPPGSPVDLEKRKRLTLAVLEGEGIIPSSGQ